MSKAITLPKPTTTERATLTPTTIKIRVLAEAPVADEVANRIQAALAYQNLVLTDRSMPYPCRPPDESKSRIYLTFVAAKVSKS